MGVLAKASYLGKKIRVVAEVGEAVVMVLVEERYAERRKTGEVGSKIVNVTYRTEAANEEWLWR